MSASMSEADLGKERQQTRKQITRGEVTAALGKQRGRPSKWQGRGAALGGGHEQLGWEMDIPGRKQ